MTFEAAGITPPVWLSLQWGVLGEFNSSCSWNYLSTN